MDWPDAQAEAERERKVALILDLLCSLPEVQSDPQRRSTVIATAPSGFLSVAMLFDKGFHRRPRDVLRDDLLKQDQRDPTTLRSLLVRTLVRARLRVAGSGRSKPTVKDWQWACAQEPHKSAAALEARRAKKRQP